MKPLPELILPAWASRVGRRLPVLPARLALVHSLNHLYTRGILPADMSLFAGRRMEIAILDAGINIRFTADEQRFIARSFSGTPDLRLCANGIDYLRMMLREEDPDTLFFKRKLHIEGDTELGLVSKNLLDSVDWQRWRELLPRLPGWKMGMAG